MGKPELEVVVFSDYICPFCYIGDRRLARLTERFDLKVDHRYLEIHPDTPSEGMPLSELGYAPDQWSRMMAHLSRMAEEENIPLAEREFTTNSHRALLLAEAAQEASPPPPGRPARAGSCIARDLNVCAATFPLAHRSCDRREGGVGGARSARLRDEARHGGGRRRRGGAVRPASRGPLPKRPCTERVDAPLPARRPTEAYPLRYGEEGNEAGADAAALECRD